MKVDIFTLSRDLDDIMLKDYPGKITGEQYCVDDSEEPKQYCFLNLEQDMARGFLRSQIKYEFEMRSSEGKILWVNYGLGDPKSN